ncbi:unnamed protein product [Mytilus edulis]|uniref:Peptidase M12B propeptide domain-containing protein n=1 Tax=Mytilus edulis TaxID=6550 RepID=A0A8S3QSI7_MYTED|nr:unnamed protein product [Mytilus edulis]
MFICKLVHICLFVHVVYANHGSIDEKLGYYETLESVDIESVAKRSIGDSPHNKHVKFSALGRNFSLNLEVAKGLFTQDFKVHLVNSDGTFSDEHLDTNSFYYGTLDAKTHLVINRNDIFFTPLSKKMSMWKFVTKKRSPDDIVLRLPNPDNATNKDAADKIKAANTEIVNSLATDESTTSTKRGVKRKASNNHYTPETRAKIAKYATEHGNVAAARKFSKDLQLDIKESAVRAMKPKQPENYQLTLSTKKVNFIVSSTRPLQSTKCLHNLSSTLTRPG